MDWLISIGITACIFIVAPFVAKYVIEPYCIWANHKVFGKKEETR